MLDGDVHLLLCELRKLREEIKWKRRGKLTRGVWLLQDNAPAHTSQVAVNAASDCGFRILPHPPIHLIWPRLTSTSLLSSKFETDDEVINAVEAFLGGV